MVICANMDPDQSTSIDLPDFSVDYLDPGIWGSSFPWKEPTSFGRKISLLGLHIPFPCIQAMGKEFVSFPSSHNRGLHPIPGTATSFPEGFWAERAQPLSLATLAWIWAVCDRLLLIESGAFSSCQLESSTRVRNMSTDWASLDAKHSTNFLALLRADLEAFYLACRQKLGSYRKEW